MKRQLFNVAVLAVGVPFLLFVGFPVWAYYGVRNRIRRRRTP